MTKTLKVRMLYSVLIAIVLAPVVLLAIASAVAKRPANLGVRDGRLADCPSQPNCVCSQASDTSHSVAAIPFTDTPSEVMARVRRTVEALPGARVITADE